MPVLIALALLSSALIPLSEGPRAVFLITYARGLPQLCTAYLHEVSANTPELYALGPRRDRLEGTTWMHAPFWRYLWEGSALKWRVIYGGPCCL